MSVGEHSERTSAGTVRVGASMLVALLELVLCLSIFGPQPLGWLWVGSQVDFATDSLSGGLAVAFVGSVTTIVLTVWRGSGSSASGTRSAPTSPRATASASSRSPS